jgi:hypothetical protein
LYVCIWYDVITELAFFEDHLDRRVMDRAFILVVIFFFCNVFNIHTTPAEE